MRGRRHGCHGRLRHTRSGRGCRRGCGRLGRRCGRRLAGLALELVKIEVKLNLLGHLLGPSNKTCLRRRGGRGGRRGRRGRRLRRGGPAHDHACRRRSRGLWLRRGRRGSTLHHGRGGLEALQVGGRGRLPREVRGLVDGVHGGGSLRCRLARNVQLCARILGVLLEGLLVPLRYLRSVLRGPSVVAGLAHAVRLEVVPRLPVAAHAHLQHLVGRESVELDAADKRYVHALPAVLARAF
mmetsp:Transcript_32251/g.100155  ORF Transcript_32251/g.100155 Transcript_32251/m.100155 type:complete len:239 (-) Transcript_32251:278-994(-)